MKFILGKIFQSFLFAIHTPANKYQLIVIDFIRFELDFEPRGQCAKFSLCLSLSQFPAAELVYKRAARDQDQQIPLKVRWGGCARSNAEE